MIERRYGAFLFVLWVALSFAVAPGRAQSSEDIGALNKQVDELVQRGNYTEATVLALRALAAVERQLGPDNQDVALHLSKVARLYEYRGLYDDAEPLRKRALATMEQALGPDHLGVAGSKEMLARLYRIQRRYADAEQLLKGALATREKVVGLEGVGVCQSLGQLAVLHETRGVYADAEPYRTRCLAISWRRRWVEIARISARACMSWPGYTESWVGQRRPRRTAAPWPSWARTIPKQFWRRSMRVNTRRLRGRSVWAAWRV